MPASAYVGLYENTYFGALEIAQNAGGLTLKFGKGLNPFALTTLTVMFFISILTAAALMLASWSARLS